jgi:hypothetical protein
VRLSGTEELTVLTPTYVTVCCLDVDVESSRSWRQWRIYITVATSNLLLFARPDIQSNYTSRVLRNRRKSSARCSYELTAIMISSQSVDTLLSDSNIRFPSWLEPYRPDDSDAYTQRREKRDAYVNDIDITLARLSISHTPPKT